MATRYVNSAAVGANDGTSWADAYTTLFRSYSEGDVVLVASTHTETVTGTWNSRRGNVIVRSASTADDSYTPGATLTLSGFVSLENPSVLAGFTINQSGNNFDCDAQQGQTLIDCTINQSGTGDRIFNYIPVRLIGCTINQSNDPRNSPAFDNSEPVEMLDCTVSGLAASVVGGQRLVARSCDFSGMPADFVPAQGFVSSLSELENCVLPSGWVPTEDRTSNSYQTLARFTDCTLDGSSGAILDVQAISYEFQAGVDESVTRTGGAAYSLLLDMAASPADLNAAPGEMPPASVYVTGGSAITITAYITSDTALTDDECWIEIQGPPSAGRQGYFWTSENRTAAAAALTSDGGSTWAGTGPVNDYLFTHTYTPLVDGFVHVRLFANRQATAKNIWLDPKVVIS